MEPSQKDVSTSRRDFLKFLSATAGATILSACAGKEKKSFFTKEDLENGSVVKFQNVNENIVIGYKDPDEKRPLTRMSIKIDSKNQVLPPLDLAKCLNQEDFGGVAQPILLELKRNPELVSEPVTSYEDPGIKSFSTYNIEGDEQIWGIPVITRAENWMADQAGMPDSVDNKTFGFAVGKLMNTQNKKGEGINLFKVYGYVFDYRALVQIK